MRIRSSARALALSVLVSTAAVSGAALAQPSASDRAAAAALFEDGKRLKADGKIAEACIKLEESQKLDPGIGTLYHLADCYERAGRTASAWVSFRDTGAMAAQAGQPGQEKAARARAAELEPKLMKLSITVKPDAGAIEIKRDGQIISPALWGTAIPVDPGKHVITASAAGKEPWETTVSLDQQGATVTVEVPLLGPKKGGVAPPPNQPPPKPNDKVEPPKVEPPPAAPDTSSPRPWQLPLGGVLLGVGAVGMGLGIGFGVMAKGTFNESNEKGYCNAEDQCTAQGLTLREDAVQKGNIGTGVFIAGAVLGAAGIIVMITAPRAKKTSGAPALYQPSIAVGPTGASARFAF